MKKLVKAFLMCMTVLFFMNTNAQADGTKVTIDDREWIYVVTDESAKTAEIITFYPCGKNTAVLPSSVDGYTVTSFKGTDDVFKRKTGLISVEIPGTVKVIPSAAFKEDSSLSTVTLHEGIETIDISAFSYSGISTIDLPQGLKTIASYAFANCSNLTSIFIPDSVTKIDKGAFDNCNYENLTIYSKAYDNDNKETAAFQTAKSIGCKFIDLNLGEYAFINYNLDGGTQNSENPLRYFSNKSESWTLKDPNKEGYAFKYWIDDDDNKITSLTNTAASNSSVIAVWEPIEYKVKFNGNDSYVSGSMDDITATYDDAETVLPENKFKRPGYVFIGWNTDKNADENSENIVDKALLPNLSTTQDAEVTLYAIWKAEYIIDNKKDAGGKKTCTLGKYLGSDSTVVVPAAIDGYIITDEYNHIFYDDRENLETVILSDGFTILQGNVFEGCEKIKDVYFPDSMTWASAGAFDYNLSIKIHGNKDKYAYRYVIEANDSEVQYTPQNFIFCDTVLGKRSVISYNLEGGINSADNPFEIYEGSPATVLKAPSKTGFAFDGWYDINDTEYKQPVTSIESGNKADRTFVAHWVKTQYKVEFNGNGSTSGSMEAMTFEVGESKKLSENTFARTGYMFNGWNIKADGSGKAYIDKIEVKNLSETHGAKVILYAQWVPVTYAINYVLDGGSNDASNPVLYTIETETIILKDAVKDKFKFLGWYKDDVKVTQILKGSTGSITLTAKWEASPEDPPAPEVTIGFEKAKLYINKGAKISSKFNNPDKLKVTFTSSNKNVVAVDSKGKLTAKKVGKAVITAKVSSKKYKCTVAVYDPKLDGSSTVAKGKSITLKIKNGYGKTTWKTSNKKIATVSTSGKVTGKKKGTVTITAVNNGKTLKKKITVK